MSVTVEQLVDVARRELLVSGGVDNWEWYDDSLEDYGYVESDDVYEDTASWLNALDLGGVDNWDWYGESLTGLDDYEEYLTDLNDLTDAPSIYVWRELAAAKAAVDEAAKPVVVEEVPAPKVRGVEGETEQRLYDLIVERYGADRAAEIFQKAIDAGIWKYTTFQKEFTKATKSIVAGLKNPLETARAALFDSVLKNKKLVEFLDDLVDI